ncbi:MAG: hypothetical protein JO053_02515 [Acidobacteria bacterium]|nr:hypothetical protein [Acidobacteriota bacterium]
MFVVRNVFKCKPGQAKNVIGKFKAAHELMADTIGKPRLLVDEVADFWTVVVEVEVKDIAKFEEALRERGSRDDVKNAMAGYLDMVVSGYREVFRVV